MRCGQALSGAGSWKVCWVVLAGLLALAPVSVSGAPAKHDTPDWAQTRKQTWMFQDKQPTPDWAAVSGSWRVASDPEHPANRLLRQAATERQEQVFLSRDDYANFDFSVRVRTDTFESRTRNWQVGILFRRADQGHYYKLRLTAANLAFYRAAPVSGYSVLGDAAASTASARNADQEQLLLLLPLGLAPDRWATLGVGCLGEKITLSLDGRVVRVLFDPGVGCGRLGLYTYKTQAFFDDVQLTYWPVPQVPNGPLPVRTTYHPLKDPELIVYYPNPQDGPVRLDVLTSSGRVFNTLAQGPHSAGLNSATWNGQGLSGRPAPSGWYTLQWVRDQDQRTVKVRIQR